MDIRIGHGYDVHRLAEGLRLVVGGVEIEHTKGCVAHSDGDVAIHAICDALLGALALGDIGKLFPDTSAEFKGIDSRLLLRRVCDIVASRGYSISNVDCTIALQRLSYAHTSTLCESVCRSVWASLRTASRSKPPPPKG